MDLKKVNIFLLGSRKSGTTSLANFLDSHDEISLSKIKESNYWDSNAIERTKSLEEYHALFDWSVRNQLDASTGYTSFPICEENIPKNIFEYNPKAKLIYIVRHPMERIISHYKMSFERGDLQCSLKIAIHDHELLLACGKYFSQLQRFLNFFPKNQLLVLKSNQLNNQKTQDQLTEFLGLENKFVISIQKDNAANSDYRMPRKADAILNSKMIAFLKILFPKSIIHWVKQMVFNSVNSKLDVTLDKETIEFLKDELYSDIDQLRNIVDFDLDDWKNFEDYK